MAQRLALVVAGALVAAGIAVAPAIGASEAPGRLPVRRAAEPTANLATFTPAAADPRLAAMFAQSGLGGDGFRFTPAETRRIGRTVTVAVRSRATRSLTGPDRTTAASVGLAPIAYNLGAAIGWKRFAISGDVARLDLQGQPGSREAADVGVSYTLNRFTGRVKGLVDRPLNDAPRLVTQAPSYSVDVGGAYRLTHNVDVTAGVRYRMDRDRLQRPDEQQARDSQAVYVGTAFRF